ncbi:unnamed protein product [Alternaria alternata]
MPILITGASGYLGGSLLAQLRNTALPGNETIYALVRSQEQAEAVKEYDVLPFTLDLQDEKSVRKNIVDAQIFVVYFLVDAVNCDMQIPLIKALGEVKRQTGREVHFLHTSGAKMFSEHAGMPTDRRLVDTDPALYDLQKSSESPHEFFTKTWPVCHIDDNTKLYVKLLKSILSGENPGYGKDGYYLASSGSMAWYDIYAAMAKALAKRGVISSPDVERADDAALDKMAQALGCPKDMVAVQLGGK